VEIIVTEEYIRKLQRDIDNTDVEVRVVKDAQLETDTSTDVSPQKKQSSSG
jgi:hypothetical protein